MAILSNEDDESGQKEFNYRVEHGDTIQPDETLCKNCRNVSKGNRFCWDCDSGSKYIPLTRPLFNIYLMLLSLRDGLNSSEIISAQKGFIEALEFSINPFYSKVELIRKFREDVLCYCDGKPSPDEIVIEDIIRDFEQPKETNSEKEYRQKSGSIRTHALACKFCVFSDRFETKFCWECDRGTRFKSGVRNISVIVKMLMYINTTLGQKLINQENNTELACISVGFAEGLKWIINPYITEEEIIEKNGFEYVSQEDMTNLIEFENNEYDELKRL